MKLVVGRVDNHRREEPTLHGGTLVPTRRREEDRDEERPAKQDDPTRKRAERNGPLASRERYKGKGEIFRPNPNPHLNSASPDGPTPPPKSLSTLTDLHAGHYSRRIVEIIFDSSWSSRGAPFPGEIEMLFRVDNPQRTVTLFEEYRTAVKAAAEGASNARCAADGNEMMRFQCPPSSSSVSSATVHDAIYAARVVACAGGRIRTFARSGDAHHSVGGGGGRRSMLVCRVIAGRIRSGPCEPSGRCESVSTGRGELLVFDPCAVLPCFLIIYRLLEDLLGELGLLGEAKDKGDGREEAWVWCVASAEGEPLEDLESVAHRLDDVAAVEVRGPDGGARGGGEWGCRRGSGA
ncbi:hypothetical protein J5N97_025651 [Dioscorea zingiberensis]|uniref:Uncharacterized protein n=1 Tax=Dioscorea zingiberensis TaxID=325984 RepID=A0A9D5C201_9LILI|nr:hypothetical protein J5N97_025651 [Dioscorea zingiberensis]